jgi:hypothetical protein
MSHRICPDRYLLQHVHGAQECGAAFASFSGYDSALRHQPTMASCLFGGHAIWWDVRAASEAEALRLLPLYVAQRTIAVAIADVEIP